MSHSVKRLISEGKIFAAVLAGGPGGRLNAITRNYLIPKPLVPIGNRKSIDYPLEALRKLGLRDVTLAVFFLGGQVRRNVSGPAGITPNFVEDKTFALDTGGAVANVVRKQGWDASADGIVIVQSSDIIHQTDLQTTIEWHLATKAAATIVVNPVKWNEIGRFGTVQLAGMPQRNEGKPQGTFERRMSRWTRNHERESLQVVAFREKQPRYPDESGACLSNLANASIYVFNMTLIITLMKLLTRKKRNEPLFPDLYELGGPTPLSDWGKHIFDWLMFPANREKFPLFAYVERRRSYWKDIGIGSDLLQANLDILDGKFDGGLEKFQKTEWGWIGNNVVVFPTARLDQSFIGDRCQIGPGAVVRHSLIGADTVIGAGARIIDSVVFPASAGGMQGNFIGGKTKLRDCLFLGGSVVGGSFKDVMVYNDSNGNVATDSLQAKPRQVPAK